ncbi:MAG: sigma-70 family RNA polymerase sigma factor [Paenisporosarcina sp.]
MKEFLFVFYNQSDGKNFLMTEKHLQNPVIKSFLAIPENNEFLKEVINSPTNNSKQKLDDAFREFYFKIRFTSYLSKSIHFNAINYDKKLKLLQDRHQFILDKPAQVEEGTPLIDLISSKAWQEEQDVCSDSSSIEDHLTSYSLFKGIQLLTQNQRQLLSLAYVYGLTDSEIATYLCKSQQAVSKSHKKALRKLREIIENTEKEGV